MKTLSLFGIDVLEYDCSYRSTGYMEYHEVYFLLKGLKKYKDRCVVVNEDWKIEVSTKQGDGECELEFYLMENEDFKQKLYKKYPNKVNIKK